MTSAKNSKKHYCRYNYLQDQNYSNCKAFIDKLDKSSCQIDLISFNYTQTVDQIRDRINAFFFSNGEQAYINDNQVCLFSRSDYVSKRKKTLYTINNPKHIHGTLYGKKDDIILGVNDVSQILNGILQNADRIVGSIVKPRLYSEQKAEGYNRLIQSANLIVLFGVSIGQTDRLWWEAIINHLKRHDCRLIIFSHKDCEEPVLNWFLSFDKNLTGNRIKDRIFVSCNSNMFKIS